MPLETPPPPKSLSGIRALFQSRTSHGDTTLSIERVSFVLTYLTCSALWLSGRDIPPNLASFLNVLVAAVFGQGILSTVGFVARKTTDATVAVANNSSASTHDATTTTSTYSQ